MNKIDIYDVVIIGGGISGLYAGYNILKKTPNKSILILEKETKEWIGGRAGNDDFYGTQVATGAGIGRKDKNPLLIKLLTDLNIKFYEFDVDINYSSLIKDPIDVNKAISLLKKNYTSELSDLTFKQFASQVLTKPIYKNFVLSSGYSDYEKADVYETLYNYGMDDTKSGWVGLSVPWKKLVETLCNKIGWSNIKCSCTVTKIQLNSNNHLYKIYSESGQEFYSSQVIIATTIKQARKLIPGARLSSSPYQQICSQPFLRVYGKFDKQSVPLLKQLIPTYTVVPGPLQKLIPINPSQGIYMIAYSDNASALTLEPYSTNTERNRKIFQKLIKSALGLGAEENIKLIGIKGYYWSEGTHYYKPLDPELGFKTRKRFLSYIQNPQKGLYVVGEGVSRYQGWVEGALQSVQSILPKI
jgi:hypothetical protein